MKQEKPTEGQKVLARTERPAGAGRQRGVGRIAVGISGWALVLFILAALAWLGILHVMLVIFFGILIGILLRSLANGVGRKTGMSSGWSLAVVVIALSGL